MSDESTYGFSKPDALELLQKITSDTAETTDRKDRNGESFRFGITQGVIAAGSYGTILLLNPVDSPTGYEEGEMEFEGWSYPSGLAAGVTVACFRGYGRWNCFEVC